MSFIHNLGFTIIDIAASDTAGKSQIDQLLAIEDPSGEAAKVREYAELYQMELDELFVCFIWVDGVKVQVNQSNKQLRERMLDHFERLCQFASLAGFRSVMGVPGGVQDALGFEGSMERSAEVLRAMVRIAGNYGLKFRVEPHRGSLLDKPEAALKMAKEVAGLEYTLDFLHYIAHGIPQEEVMPLLDYAGHLHARQACLNWPKCPVELGTIDYGAIIERLKALKWNGVITMEFWNGPKEHEAGINPVFQNILMAYQLEYMIKHGGAEKKVIRLY